jgi:hypothetical protein
MRPADFNVNSTLEYNNNKYQYQHASSLNDSSQILVNKSN